MDAINWALFLPACFALSMAPGPNNLLAFTHAARFGAALAILGGAGRLVAFFGLIALVIVGLGAILQTSATAFFAVKLLGAAYLIYVGVKLLRAGAPPAPRETLANPRELARHEFMIAAGNPKAIAIFTAFFPQFVDAGAPAMPQLMALGLAFLVLESVAICLYALAGRVARGLLRNQSLFGWLNKGVGAFLIGSGVSLAFSSR